MKVHPASLPRSLVLVANPRAGHIKRGVERARGALARAGLQIVDTVRLDELDRLAEWIERPEAERPLIVAAGGDGTVGSVADHVADTGAILGILPLGTSNDVARSFDIPMRLDAAVRLLVDGTVATVDLGQFLAPGDRPRHFVHAAAMGLNVAFAKLATQTSLRKRLGRFTYAVAAVATLRERKPFTCELELEGRRVSLCLLHLSVMNAPVFGGRWDLRIDGSNPDDRRLDVLAIEDMPLHRLVFAVLPILLRRRLRVGGVRVYHVRKLYVHVAQPLDVSLDGELVGRIPGDFVVAAEALRIVAGPRFVDVDDPPAGT